MRLVSLTVSFGGFVGCEAVRAVFKESIANARTRYRQASSITGQALAVRENALTELERLVERIGVDNFQDPDVATSLGKSKAEPYQDWMLYAIANAITACHTAVTDPDHEAAAKAALSSLQNTLIDQNELTLLDWPPVELSLSPNVLLEIRNHLERRGAFGAWVVGVNLDRGEKIAMRKQGVEVPYSLAVWLDPWFSCRVIDGTIVLESEAREFGTKRALALLTEAKNEHASAMAKSTRAQNILSTLSSA